MRLSVWGLGLIFLLCCILAPGSLKAKHIIGGDVTYECVFIDTVNNKVTFQIEFIMYRDCYDPTGANFDPDAEFGVYRKSNNTWVYVTKTEPLNFRNLQSVSPNENPCLIVPPNVCVEKADYKFNITLDIINDPYLISFQRCCRNNTISNIFDPGGTGAVFSTEISPEAQQSCNNSPKFNAFPPIVICADFELNFDHSATDIDGDLLVYEFCGLQSAGGQNTNNPNNCTFVKPNPTICGPENFVDVRFRLPAFSETNPLGGEPAITIDPNTGVISGIPQNLGQYVVGVCVKEFRLGKLIGTLSRDFQFNVTNCQPTVFANIQSDEEIGTKQYLINSCGNNTISFVNESIDENFIEEYYWEFGAGGDMQTFNTRDATVTFPGLGEYEGLMVLNPGTECSDTANIFVNVFPAVEADYQFSYDTCVAGPVLFEDLSTTGADFLVDWEWDFKDGNFGSGPNTSHLFSTPGFKNVSLIVTDNNGCTDEAINPVDWRPVPPLIVIDPSTFIGCAPASVFFNNLSTPIDSTYTINWDFGNGGTGDEISPTYVYEEEGTYSVAVEIISPIGCKTARSFTNWIRVEPKPEADFAFSPTKLNSFTKTADFFDASFGAVGYLWNFNEEGTAITKDATHTFRDTGVAFVDLVVVHESGCTDTIRKLIDIVPEVTYFMPNAFTPNGDGTNDLFLGKGFLDGLREFRMTIWSRWGELIFESSDPGEGWNGQKNNSGTLLPGGVYVYIVEYIDPRGENTELKGFATLVR